MKTQTALPQLMQSKRIYSYPSYISPVLPQLRLGYRINANQFVCQYCVILYLVLAGNRCSTRNQRVEKRRGVWSTLAMDILGIHLTCLIYYRLLQPPAPPVLPPVPGPPPVTLPPGAVQTLLSTLLS